MFKRVKGVRNWLGGTCSNCGNATPYDMDYCPRCRGGR